MKPPQSTMTPAQLAEWERAMKETGWPDARPVPTGVRHGTMSTATAYGCHCGPCTEAGRIANRAEHRPAIPRWLAQDHPSGGTGR